MGSVLFAIYGVKTNKGNWLEEEKAAANISGADPAVWYKSPTHDIRAWLLIECGVFICWIACSMMFTFYAYIFKIKSICKSEIVMESDDNVWNDKNTDDFLRYLKFEYFMVNYILLKAVTEIYIGFIPRADITIFGPKHESNSYIPTGLIFTLLLINSVIVFVNATYMLTTANEKLDIDHADADLYKRTKQNRLWILFKGVTWLGCFIGVVVLYFFFDQMKGANTMAKHWV